MQHFTHTVSSTRGRWALALLFATLLVGVLLFLTAGLTYAKSLENFPPHDCAHAQSFDQCNHQDPAAQGCAANAKTIQAVPIGLPQGTKVGLLELRHSNACNSWWGRTFSFRKGNAELSLSSSIFSENVPDSASLSLLSGGPNEVYSDMVYGRQPLTLTGFVVFSAASAAQAQINSN